MSDFTKSRISKSDDWPTPEELIESLDSEFHFDDDPCPIVGELLHDGLSRKWGSVVYMNPPYSDPEP